MRFEEAYGAWTEGRLSQEEAASLLGVCARTFRRYIDRYEEEGLDGLIDKRLSQVSHRKAPVDEVVRLEALYKERYDGWNVKHFYSFYRNQHGGTRSYTWVRNTLQKAGLVKKAPGRGKHRRRRERAPMTGMMLHQDGSSHEWVPDHHWDLIITLDDATSEHYSMFFVEEEGTASSF
jgi:transposase